MEQDRERMARFHVREAVHLSQRFDEVGRQHSTHVPGVEYHSGPYPTFAQPRPVPAPAPSFHHNPYWSGDPYAQSFRRPASFDHEVGPSRAHPTGPDLQTARLIEDLMRRADESEEDRQDLRLELRDLTKYGGDWRR
jgi:hypothetical protein